MEDQIKAIIEDVELSPALRRVALESFQALIRRQKQFEDSLQGKLFKDTTSAPTVVSGLAPIDKLADYEAQGFFVPDSAQGLAKKLGYLAVPYEQMLELCDREYLGRSGSGQVSFRLEPWSGFVEAERNLRLMWELYRWPGTQPFLPWARRCVCIETTAEGELDLCVADNGLEEIFLSDMALVWNAETRPGSVSSHRIAPRDEGRTEIYLYSAKDRGRELWILPAEISSGRISPYEVDAERSGEDIKLYSRKPFADEACQKFAFYPARVLNDKFIAWRKHERESGLPQSRADFDRLLADYSGNGFTCKMASESGEIISRYWASHRGRAGHPISEFRDTAPLRDIGFAGPSLFLTDFANMVLEDMEGRFPNWQWRGIKCGSGKR